jgi:hypothetical protein
MYDSKLYHLTTLARSSKPRTLLLSRSASTFRSKTWCAGVLLCGIHTLPPFALAAARFIFRAERSTTRGEDENLMTSRYNSFVSIARERTVGGVRGISASESESSISEGPEGSNGGVGRRVTGSGRGGSACISLSKSCPLRKEFSVRRKRTAPRRASICSAQYQSQTFCSSP